MSSSSSIPKPMKPIAELAAYGVEAYYIPDFLSVEEAKKSFSELEEKFPFHQEQTTVFGKTFDQPRLTRFMGDEGKTFNYSGHVRPAVKWIDEVVCLKNRVLEMCKKFRPNHPEFNVVLGNRYKDGNDYIGDHSDDETEHEKNAFVASLSIGAVRDFWIRDKKTGERILTIPLASGSLFLMGKNFHDKLKHGVPKRKKVQDVRINLTFRRFSDGRSQGASAASSMK
jgi:alkylated DNA repair dioxygenase AlkB